MEVEVADDFERALDVAQIKGAEVGIMLPSPLEYASLKQIGELAIAKRAPLISLFGAFPSRR